MDNVKPGHLKVLQVSNGTVYGRTLKKGDFVTAQMVESYCREFAITVDKPGSVYLCD